jgi:hypothetical protein
MKYKIIKDKLAEKGFKLEYVQTYNTLDMLQFEHPNIDGQINITFEDDEDKIPEDILNGGDFSYEDAEWLNDININSVCFEIDMSISYMSDNTLDIDGSNEDNMIYLHGEDLNLFGEVLNMVCDPYIMFNYVKKYDEEKQIFFGQIKKFLPITEKHKIPFRIIATSGNENCLYPSISVQFYVNDINSLDFNFSTLSFKKEIFPGLTYEETDCLPIDCDYDVLENIVDEKIKSNEEFLELYREQRRKKV